jgi:mono/diheme cytochrome c family protein
MSSANRGCRPPLAGGLTFLRQRSCGRVVLCALCLLAAAISAAPAQDEATARGERLYAKYCSNCHGDDLQNNSGVAFDLRRLKSDEHPRFVNSVLHGKNAMPSWQGVLAPAQLDDLWAYIRAHAYEQ